MSLSIYYRLLGQGVALTVHAGNSLAMFLAMADEELVKDLQIKDMISMQNQYFTVWNIAFQMAYFFLAFSCDYLTVTGRDILIPKCIRRFRRTFFSAIVFPSSALIFCVFWPVFIFDRELLFPAFIDKIFSFKSNLVIHFFILPAALWELAFLPRPKPKSHRMNMALMGILFILYNSIILRTYSQRGMFPYPICNMTYGTIYFPLFFGTLLMIGLGVYLLQWKLSALVWGQQKKLSTGKAKFS